MFRIITDEKIKAYLVPCEIILQHCRWM